MEELVTLWDSWSDKSIADLFSALRKFYEGKFMHVDKGEELKTGQTPLDLFYSNHPSDLSSLHHLMESMTLRPVYRAVVHDQARDVFIDVAASSHAGKSVAMFNRQEEEFPLGELQPSDFTPWNGSVEVRRFSSWTDSPTVAQAFAIKGMGEDSCAVLRADGTDGVLFTPESVKLFESYSIGRNKRLKPFFERWQWQRECIWFTEVGHVDCDAVFLASQEGSDRWVDFMHTLEWKRQHG